MLKEDNNNLNNFDDEDDNSDDDGDKVDDDGDHNIENDEEKGITANLNLELLKKYNLDILNSNISNI